MALAKINLIEYDIKEIKITEDFIEMLLRDESELKLDIDKSKSLDIVLSGNIKKLKTNGSLLVTGNVSNGVVNDTLVIDGYINEYVDKISILRLEKENLDKIEINKEKKDKTVEIEVCGTLDNFENKSNYVITVHGNIEYLECEKSVKVCGNVHRLKVGKQIMGSKNLIEASFEEEIRLEHEKEDLKRIQEILEFTCEKFK